LICFLSGSDGGDGGDDDGDGDILDFCKVKIR